MSAFTYPGVYIEEVPSGQHTITGVATSIAAFIGWSNQGPVNEAAMVESWSEYQAIFGGMIPGISLGYAVYQFFLNGGSEAYIIRLVDGTAETATGMFGGMQLYANNPGAWGNLVSVSISNVATTASGVSTFNLQVSMLSPSGTPSTVESYTNLSTSPTSPQYAVTVINNDSNYISFNPPTGSPKLPIGVPAPTGTMLWTIAGSGFAPPGTPFTPGETISQAGGATATFLGMLNAATIVVSGLNGTLNTAEWTDTSGAGFLNPSAPISSATVFVVPGSYPTQFNPGETISQSGGAHATFIGMLSPTVLVVDALAGTQNSNPWVDANGAAFSSTAVTSLTAVDSIPGSFASPGTQFTPGEAIHQSGVGGATATFLGMVNPTTLLVGGLAGTPNSAPWVDSGGVVFNGGAPVAAAAWTMTGSFNAPTQFTPQETVSQSGTAASATLLGATASSMLLEAPIGGGPANSSSVWQGATSHASFVPSGAPAVPAAVWIVAGSVTTPAQFKAGELITQSGTGAVAFLLGVINGSYLMLSAYSGNPNSSGAWTDAGGASFAPMTAPVSTTSMPLCLAGSSLSGSSATVGADGTTLLPNTSGFETQLSGSSGYQLLSSVPIFNLLCVPGENSAAVVGNMQQFCAQYRAFLIVDSAEAAVVGTGSTGLSNTGPADASNNVLTGSQYASNSAFYFPWISAPDPQVGFRPTLFPPCGFVAGLYASTDASRGVWKAPAGINIGLTGALGLQYVLTDMQNGLLNPLAVNCLRQFPIYGEVVWGARTMAGADAVGSQWKYIPIRRLALFLESSLYQGTQWAVFEPNAEPLWGQVRLSIGTFMQGLFLQGAFAGTTPQQAYFVKCDADNNPDSSVALGILNITVGFAPLYPAEFVVIQIQQMMMSQS
jgi:phage tail sheath protein FI